MAPSKSEWEIFLNPAGPVRVEHQDGTLVTYDDRGRLRATSGETVVQDSSELQIELEDATGKPGRVIQGDEVVEIRKGEPAIVVVVKNDVEPDPGDRTISRGAEPPAQAV